MFVGYLGTGKWVYTCIYGWSRTIDDHGWMFLLVPAHPGCPGQNPESRKRLCVCVCVCVYTHIRTANSRSTNWNPAPPPQKKTKILVRAYSLTSLHNYTIPAEGFTDLFPNPNPNIHRIQRKPRPTEPPPLPDTKPSRPRDERHLLYGCDKLRQAGSVRNHRPGWMTENKPSDA